jgi:ribosomal protein S18 acetylase RimI-like enzyme
VTYPVDAATVRRLLLHEARVHAVPRRRLTILPDAILLLDPDDPEPFWNRVCGITWPDDPVGFDRRLAELGILFAGMGRQPHVWLSPPHDTPSDIRARLEANGFEDMGAGYLLVATSDADARNALAGAPPGPDLVLERHGAGVGAGTGAGQPASVGIAIDIVEVLVAAFAVEPERAEGIRGEVVASLADPRFTHYLIRLDGRPVAAARAATFDGATYLSSIGTVPVVRGRGLGRSITATAMLDGFAAGSEFVHLGVFADNEPAFALYRSLGFRPSGEPGPDMLLVG